MKIIIKVGLVNALVFCAMLLVGCPSKANYNISANKSAAPAADNVITDATGITFTLPCHYSRIISLAPDITENVKLLGAEDKLAGRTDYCKVTKEIPSVGNMLEPSIEKIVSLTPDLVLATKDGNRSDNIYKIRGLNIPVFVFDESNTWDNIKKEFTLLGKLLNKPGSANDILSEAQRELDNLSKSAEPAGLKGIDGQVLRPKVFIQLNVKPLMTAGRNTFINEIITMSRGYNIAQDSILPWPSMNEEEIIRINPDVIVVCDMGGMTGEAKAVWAEQKFAAVTAVAKGKVFVMASDLLCQPTPRNFVNAVKQLSGYIESVK